MNKLNAKQKRFCLEYVKDLSATQAAIRAGYSPKSAEVQGSRLLSQDKVAAEIAKLSREITERAVISISDVTAELKTIIKANVKDFSSWKNNRVTMKDSDELSPDALRAVEQVATTCAKDGTPQLRIKLHSKLKAAELLIRIFELQEVERRLGIIEKQLGITA